MTIIDLFCGIGGVAEALWMDRAESRETADRPDGRRVIAAIDIDERIERLYEINHGLRPICKTLESITQLPSADLWWMSPPCQPYTRRGAQRGSQDPRSAALQHLIGLIDQFRPAMVFVENVPEFIGSNHHETLQVVLSRAGYAVQTDLLCPTQFGIPMRRRRAYVRAYRDRESCPDVSVQPVATPLSEFLDPTAWDRRDLRVEAALLERYRPAMHIVSAGDPDAQAACFTSAYGNSPVRAGSYLTDPASGIIRRFAATEVAALLGFRADFWWPDQLSERARYRLLGNALSVHIVRALLIKGVRPL